MNKGLIMEGGALRGMFTAGVLDVFMENNIAFDGAVGVSAGTVFGCNYKSHQIGRVIRYNKTYCSDDRYGSFKSWFKTGNLYDEELCYHLIPEKLDPFDIERYQKEPVKFYATVTDIQSGKAVYHLCDKGDLSDLKWFQASASMPLVSKTVQIDGKGYLDGGIADSIPVLFMEKMGYDRNVVILTQPIEYRKKKQSYLPLIHLFYVRYPNLVKAMDSRPEVYNRTVEMIIEKEKKGELFVLRPTEPLNIKPTETDPAELERVYQCGRKVALDQLDDLKKYLNK